MSGHTNVEVPSKITLDDEELGQLIADARWAYRYAERTLQLVDFITDASVFRQRERLQRMAYLLSKLEARA